jgi:hypothetical protein
MTIVVIRMKPDAQFDTYRRRLVKILPVKNSVALMGATGSVNLFPMLKFCIGIILVLCLASSAFADGQATAARLRCEYWDAPLNVDLPHPRLSWVINSTQRGDFQKAYQIQVASSAQKLLQGSADLWDSGKIVSDQTAQIAYAGTPLHSNDPCFWHVRVWNNDNDQPSAWSDPAHWSMGPLDPGDWKAKWIAAPGATGSTSGDESDSLGYHAAVSQNADAVKWVQVDLGKPVPIDLVKLHAMDHEVPGFGFPIRFTVAASDDPNFDHFDIIADHSSADYPNPGATAVSFKAKGISHRYVRVTASRLFHRTGGDQTYCFALAELEVFSNGKNVALHAPVQALDSTEAYGWGKAQLTDGKNLAGEVTAAADHGLKTLPVFRKVIDLQKPVARAMLHLCGLGQYELSLNGSKVGDSVLDPGWTNYRKTCLYRSCDLTTQLKSGSNPIDIALGNGMYNVIQTKGRYTKFAGSMGPPKLIAQLELTYADGTTETICSDNTWKVRGGPTTFSSIYGGEDYDARLEAASDSDWQPAEETSGPGGALVGVSQSAPPITVAQELKVQRITHPRDDAWVYDLGQNCAQMPSITVSGPAGSTVRLTPAEVLRNDGTESQQPSGGPAYFSYTLKGKGSETWSPRFSYYGCRYFQVTGAVPAGSPNPSNLPVISDLHGQFITSSSPIVGEFACSSPLFNRTAEITRWAMRSNLMSVLTDCPHREKLGWLEQSHLVGPSLMYNMGIPALFSKVCSDMSDAQTPQGLVPDIAPEYPVFSDGFRDSPEWGSACILIPWQVYQWYGDTTVLARHYDTMKRYVAYLQSQAQDNILTHGLGDWYDIGPKPPGYAQLTPISLTATAFYYRDIRILQQAAHLTGHEDDTQSLATLGDQVRESFNRAFYHADQHSYATDSQTANAIPLVMEIAPEADHQAIMQHIVDDIRKRNNGLTAGDIGYRYLLKALADGGRADVIFDMNSQSDKPGYGMIIAKGATSLTEAWDARPSSSQDHFMLGHIMEWFYGGLAGIQPDPSGVGFKKILIKPTPVGDITWARATYDSIRGPITSSWKITGNTFALDVVIPANCTADVQFPPRFSASIREGGKPVAEASDISVEKTAPGSPVVVIQSGAFHFESRSK